MLPYTQGRETHVKVLTKPLDIRGLSHWDNQQNGILINYYTL